LVVSTDRARVTVEQAREALKAGHRIRVVVGIEQGDPTTILFLRDGMVVSEVIAGWSEGVVEPVCEIESDFLAEYLDGSGNGRHLVEVVASVNPAALPDGCSAWTKDGRPVRRVATNRPAGGWDPSVKFMLPGEGDLMHELWADLAIYGDAWMDLERHRVSPFDVMIHREGSAPEAFRPEYYPRRPGDGA
jgi:hypothetical protein